MTVVRYQGPHTAVDVLGSDRMYTVGRGETVDVPEDLARKLVQSPDWTVVEPARGTNEPGPHLIPGLGSLQRARLVGAGYETIGQMAAATDEELLSVPDIGERTILTIRRALGQLPEDD